MWLWKLENLWIFILFLRREKSKTQKKRLNDDEASWDPTKRVFYPHTQHHIHEQSSDRETYTLHICILEIVQCTVFAAFPQLDAPSQLLITPIKCTTLKSSLVEIII